MEITLKNQFITLWNTYFPQAGLPITFQYSADTQNLPIVEAPKGHRCIIAQLTQVQRGKTLCMQADSVGCRGGKRYTNFTDKMFPGFECFYAVARVLRLARVCRCQRVVRQGQQDRKSVV